MVGGGVSGTGATGVVGGFGSGTGEFSVGVLAGMVSGGVGSGTGST